MMAIMKDLVFTILQEYMDMVMGMGMEMEMEMAMDFVCLNCSSLSEFISKCLSGINPYKSPPDGLFVVTKTDTTTAVPHETYVIKPIANKRGGY